MMLKITQHVAPDITTLRLEGRLTAPWIGELERVCAAMLGRPERVRLELSGLIFLDDAGVAALGRLVDARVSVTGASALVRQLLKGIAGTQETEPPSSRARRGVVRVQRRPRSNREREQELVSRLQGGDAGAFEEVVRASAGRMLATARRMLGCDEDAARAVQAAFRAAFEALAGFPATETLSGWLQGHTLRTSIRELRARSAALAVESDERLPAFDPDGSWLDPKPAVRAPIGREDSAFVRACIGRIPVEPRVALLLCDGEQLSAEEAAEVLAIPPEAVRTRLHRARMALCELLAYAPVG